MTEKKDNESLFMAWLATKVSSSQFDELDATYKSIEEECKKAHIIKDSLFEYMNIVAIGRIRSTVERSRLFRFFHKKESDQVASAIRYMLQYIQEMGEVSKREAQIVEPLPSDESNPSTYVAVNEDLKEPTVAEDEVIQPASAEEPQPSKEEEPSPEERVKEALRQESTNNQYGATPYYLGKIAGLSVAEVRKMLNTAPWARKVYGNYYFCEPKAEEPQEFPVAQAVHSEDSLSVGSTGSTATRSQLEESQSVDYLSDDSMAFTKPFLISYFEDRYSVKSWTDVLVQTCRLLIDDYPEVFEQLRDQGMTPGTHPVWIVKESCAGKQRAPKEIISDYYIETNRSASDMVKIIKHLLDECRVDYENLVIYYRRMVEKEPVSSVPAVESSSVLENNSYNQSDSGSSAPLDAFRRFLLRERKLAERTAGNYCTSIRMIEEYIQRNQLTITILKATTNNIQVNVDYLMARPDFVKINNERHHQFSAALAQYIEYLSSIEPKTDKPVARHNMTIKDVVIKVLSGASEPLTMPEIMRRIEAGSLYTFNSSNPSLILYQGIRRYCKGMKAPNHSPVDVFDRFTDADGQVRYMLICEEQPKAGESVSEIPPLVDDRWLPILRDSFPDGFILDDFLSQFQASAFWQEFYDEACPIEGEAIDAAMKAIGTVMDGRIFAKNNDDNQLISEICTEIKSILAEYSNVYRSCIYERYRDQLASAAIYTESVMTQQLLDAAKGSFISTYQVFSLPGQETSVARDCRKVLRKHGGAMNVSDVARELWFIPYDLVYHNLSADDEALNIGNGAWMLAEHFPLTREDATKVGDMLDECFLTNDFVLESDLIPLLQEHLPSIADNLSGLHFIAIFNILNYYLIDRFSFSKAIIAPKGAKTDFRDLFRVYASEHERFTLDELSAFASDLKVPIYWESTFSGGAVRVSRTEFIHRSLIEFDVEAADTVLESFCMDDYLALQAVSSAMMMHLPPCGYPWNGYLLLSYVYGFSKVFRLSYNSLGKTGFYGAMVRRSCEKIASYDQLVEQVLADDPTWQTEDEALNVLVNRGLQAQKRLRGIDQIVAKARQKKLSKDGM